MSVLMYRIKRDIVEALKVNPSIEAVYFSEGTCQCGRCETLYTRVIIRENSEEIFTLVHGVEDDIYWRLGGRFTVTMNIIPRQGRGIEQVSPSGWECGFIREAN